jgi:hypothetical protein
LLAAVLDRPREPLDGHTYRKQSVHLRRLDVVMVKLAMRSVLGRLGNIRGDARILNLLAAAARTRRTFNGARVPIPTGPKRALRRRG